MHVGCRDALRHTGVAGSPRRVDHEADTLPIIGVKRRAVYLIDPARFNRTDQVQAIADLLAPGHAEVPVSAVSFLGDAGGNTGFEALELTIKHEVDHARECIGAIGCGSTAGHD